MATTIGFVDLAGYTSLTEAHGDDEAFRAAQRLQEVAGAALTGRTILVKTIGDAVMLAGPDVGDMVDTVVGTLRRATRTPGFLLMSAGVWTGSAVRSPSGDWFGSAVNRAARLCSLAAPAQILVPRRTLRSSPAAATY